MSFPALPESSSQCLDGFVLSQRPPLPGHVRRALCLGKGWTKPGGLIHGLRPDADLYAFVTYTNAESLRSKPTPPLKFRLRDMFAEK